MSRMIASGASDAESEMTHIIGAKTAREMWERLTIRNPNLKAATTAEGFTSDVVDGKYRMNSAYRHLMENKVYDEHFVI